MKTAASVRQAADGRFAYLPIRYGIPSQNPCDHNSLVQARPTVSSSAVSEQLKASLHDFVHRDRLPVGIFHQPVQ